MDRLLQVQPARHPLSNNVINVCVDEMKSVRAMLCMDEQNVYKNLFDYLDE